MSAAGVGPIARMFLPPAGDPLVKICLVPVEVFGTNPEPCEHCGEETGGGYGLCDAVEAWSDCNRAIGRIYRVDDLENRSGETITVYVPQSEIAKFAKRYAGDAEDICQGCRKPLTELPAAHRATVVCNG